MSGNKGIKVLVIVITFMVGIIFGELLNCNRKDTTITKTVVEVQHDTTYTMIHDTCFIEKICRTVRNDTVLLAMVDTITAIDSILVEVPIEEKRFDGEHYSILTEGFRVQLKSVDIEYPTITNTITKTITRQKHWSGSVGLQAGYGITAHGWSPYAGLGVGFGYSF